MFKNLSMKHILFSFLLSFQVSLLLAQTPAAKTNPNLGFEEYQRGQPFPTNWFKWGSGYSLSVDSTEVKEGKLAMKMQSPKQKQPDSFGCIASKIPAIYDGKEIELRGFFKIKNVGDGSAGLMLRIDGNSGVLQFDNMEQHKINGSVEWKQYSIILPYNKSAQSIFVGALLSGTGEMWVDQLELLIDGKPYQQAPIKQLYLAELDKEFDKGSNIADFTPTGQQISDLSDLGKVWGFLKYYHPAIAEGKHQWDYELLRVLPKIITAKSKADKQQAIHSLIDKLGTFKSHDTAILEDGVDKIVPDLSWFEKSFDDEKLLQKLALIEKAERSNDHYYIGMNQHVGNPEFKNENAYPQHTYPDAGFRLLSLFRYWNMIEYFFPYKYLTSDKWDKVLPEFIPKFVAARDEREYKLAALALIAKVQDTHANIFHDPALDKYFGLQYAPLEVNFVEDKAVVTDYLDQNIGEKSGLKRGDIIETINGKKIQQIIEEQLPITPASNYPTQLRNIARNLLRSNDSLLTVTYRRDQKQEKVQLKTYPQNEINIYANFNSKDSSFKHIRPDVSYLFPGKIKNSHLPAIAPDLLKTKGLIIDLRCYPTDFIAYTFANYLLPEPKPFVKFSHGSINRPGTFTMTGPQKTGSVNPDYYKGKIVIIINEQTQSQAEFTTMAFSTAPQVTVIGSTTAAADGNFSSIVLPGLINTGISGIGVYYPDGGETQRIGIVPDVVVKPTIKGITEGRDELLEKAIQIIDGK